MKRLCTLFAYLLLSLSATGAMAQQYASLDTSSQPLSNMICGTCHGAYGQGNPVVGGPRLAGMEDWYLKAQLKKFRAQHRGTQNDYVPGFEMQATVATMSDSEIDDVIAYISTWKFAPRVATVSGDVSNGAQLFTSCAACHGSDASGNEALSAPALAGRSDWYLYRQLKLFKSGYRGSHPDDVSGMQMRAAAQVLNSDKNIKDVLAYINTLSTDS